MNQAPEFSRLVRIDTVGGAPRELKIGADEAERAALAERFGLVAIDRLSAEASLTRNGEEVKATGRISAAVTQSCVGTGVPIPAEVDEPFSIIFRPVPTSTGAEEEIELSEGEMDVVFYDGAAVDVGEAVAESMALSLDPFPRSPEADAALREAGVKKEDEVERLGPLAGLKDLLEGKKG